LLNKNKVAAAAASKTVIHSDRDPSSLFVIKSKCLF